MPLTDKSYHCQPVYFLSDKDPKHSEFLRLNFNGTVLLLLFSKGHMEIIQLGA